MTNIKDENLGGRPSLQQQAENAHTKAETRIDLEMGKAAPKALKAFMKLVDKLPDLKENQQLTIIEKVFKYNKEYMRELQTIHESGEKLPQELTQEEDHSIMIDLNSAPIEEAKLN